MELVLELNRLKQMTCDGCCGFDLLEDISLIYMVIGILYCVIIGITIIGITIKTQILLDLDDCCHTILTEWTLIPSSTTCYDSRY